MNFRYVWLIWSSAFLLPWAALWLLAFVGGLIFLVYFGVFMLALLWSAPGYIEAVWNLSALTGIRLASIPLEELLYGFAFGMCWTGVYEHIMWRGTPRSMRQHHRQAPMAMGGA